MKNYSEEIKISVIIPIFNSGLYLQECLDSILSQTLQDIEVICVNDGSTDDSVSIIQSIRDDRIVLINQINKGAGYARNIGIKLARGKYVAFMDPDDLYASDDVLEELFVHAEENGAIVCGGNILNFFEKENPFLTDTYSKYHIKKAGFRTTDEYQNPWGHTKYVFRRDFIIERGLFYPTYRRGEDPVFMIKMLDSAQKVYLFPKTIYLYRQYRNRKPFSSKVLIELLDGYYETMLIALEKDNYNAFLDCAQQLRYWGECIGLDEWDNSKYWEFVQKLNLLIAEGKNKWNCDMTISLMYSREEISRKIVDLAAALEEAKKKSNEKQLYIYGAGIIAKSLVEILRRFDINDYGVVVSGEGGFFFEGIKVESIEDIIGKNEYLYLIAIADMDAQRDVVNRLRAEQIMKYILIDPLVTIKGLADSVFRVFGKENEKSI